MEKRDKWEEAIRAKLEHFETKPDPGDWEAIANRLSDKVSVVRMKKRRWVYRAAAAVVSLLLLGGGYRLWFQGKQDAVIAEVQESDVRDIAASQEKPQTDKADGQAATERTDENPVSTAAHRPSLVRKDKDLTARTTYTAPKENSPSLYPTPEKNEKAPETTSTEPTEKHAEEERPNTVQDHRPENTPAQNAASENRQSDNERPLIADASPRPSHRTAAKRRWGFGMGGGSFSTGSYATADGANFFANSIMNRDLPAYSELKSFDHAEKMNKIDVSHKRPLSFGVGISYRLSDRWALQSGVTYTYMTSTWRTEAIRQGKAKQRLHFVGLPLGVNYKIAEWQRVRFYAGAGAMVEWNVAGSIDTDYYYGNEMVNTLHASVRMKEWQWSVNARTGASYPLLRYLSAYVEGNANYYFDNGSAIETIRSEKPFYVSLQAGVRIGF
ncbi:porin family protein [Tannerella forsythia]